MPSGTLCTLDCKSVSGGHARVERITPVHVFYVRLLRLNVTVGLWPGKFLIEMNMAELETNNDSVFNCSSQGQKTEAERYFLKAIQLDPMKGNCYMHYGECL